MKLGFSCPSQSLFVAKVDGAAGPVPAETDLDSELAAARMRVRKEVASEVRRVRQGRRSALQADERYRLDERECAQSDVTPRGKHHDDLLRDLDVR
jgi:hypothetical protein